MISLEDALKHVGSNRPELGIENVAVKNALVRTLPADMIAPLGLPPFMSANMVEFEVPDCQARDNPGVIAGFAAVRPFSGSVNTGTACIELTPRDRPIQNGENVDILLLGDFGLPR